MVIVYINGYTTDCVGSIVEGEAIQLPRCIAFYLVKVGISIDFLVTSFTLNTLNSGLLRTGADEC